jgi:CheY-like chemotaxis protein
MISLKGPSAVGRTLIADDDPNIIAALRLLLKSEGCEPNAVTSPAAVIEALEHSQFDVVLIDLNYARDTTSGREGLDLSRGYIRGIRSSQLL